MTNDVDRRLLEHNAEDNVGSYTSNRKPVDLLWHLQLTDFQQAEELEKQIKGWSRKKKEALILGEWDELKVLAACKNQTSYKNKLESDSNSERSLLGHPERSPLGHPERSRRVHEEDTTHDGVRISCLDSKNEVANESINSSPFDSAQDDCLLPSWQSFLQAEESKSYYKDLQAFLKLRRKEGAIIYPPENEIFNAFKLTPLEKVKVVILGQDPYHGEGQAHGLCFSVRKGNRIPPSLRNIFKELNADLGHDIPDNGELTAWAQQGVFLLNAILTVEQKTPAAHKGKGWETFSDAVIQHISEHRDKVVFILWGAYAQKKKSLIDESKHLVLAAPHPAAEVYAGGKAGFFGSKPFSKANEFLDDEVDWSL